MNIQEFYETFPYPPLGPLNAIAIPGLPSDFVAINHYVFGGRWTRDKPFRVLVAGCGTGLSVTALGQQLAAMGVPFSMLCIDVSSVSLEIARARAASAGLSELMVFQCRAIEALETEAAYSFDYIDLTGVLNHVEDPARILAVLNHVLADPGGLGVMAYGALGRTGIYPIQDALRLLRLTTKESVPAARALLRNLPRSNWLRLNPILEDFETISDTEFADRFLNPRDRAFSVRDLGRLFGDVGFGLRAFLPPIFYEPRAILSDRDFRDRAEELPAVEQWYLAEQLQGSLYKHTFYAIKSSDPLQGRIDFADPDYRAIVRGPIHRHLANAFAGQAGNRISIAFQRDSQHHSMGLELSELEIKVLSRLNDGENFGEIRIAFQPNILPQVNAAIQRVCKALLSVDALYLEITPGGS
jgi:SAM-dependent methyltransferase